MGIYIPNINANQFDKLCEEKGLKFIYISVPTPHGDLIDADALMGLYEPAPEDVVIEAEEKQQ